MSSSPLWPLHWEPTFQCLLSAGLSGILLGIITVITTGLGGYYAYALTNHGKPRAVGAAIGSCAGICSSTPLYVATVDPSLMSYTAEATAACTTATLLTAILCPILVSMLAHWDKKKDAKRARPEGGRGPGGCHSWVSMWRSRTERFSHGAIPPG